MKQALIFILLIFPVLSFAQGFSNKTNRIHLDYTKRVAPTSLPRLTWLTPRAEVSNSLVETIQFEVDVQSDVALRSLTLEIENGGEVRSKKIPFDSTRALIHVSQSVRLLDGENVVRLIAINNKGGRVSSERSILTGKDAISDAVDINRKDYALLFATDQYENWTDLVNPVNDARTIAAILRDKYGFQTEIVENASNDEILTKIYDYNTRKFNPQDQLFVFFAGHGSFDETLGEGYVVAANSQLNDKGRTSYISHILIRERLNNIQCEHIFLMMDVCFGGTFDPVLAQKRAQDDMDEAADKQYLVKKLTKRTRKFITSGGKEYVPDGVPGRHSPFAEKFILALREIGGGTGRILSLLELYPYFLKLPTEPRFGSFGTDDPASDFVFVARQ